MSKQMRPISRNPDSDIEFVEDSEPERVLLRNKPASDAGMLNRNISASGMHQRRLDHAGLHTAATVIEISDSESSTSSCLKDAIMYGSASIGVNPVEEHQQGPSKSTLDIKKFAFKPLSIKQQVQPSITSLPRLPERPRAPKKVRMDLDSLLSDITRVSRCVCCSISWTTRKTAPQKKDHIQRCAKKKGFDDETVRILIKNEIASSKDPNIGHCKVPTTHSTSTTLLEDVVQPRSNKRKNVHPNNQLSLGSPLREAILSRAKDIITGPSPDEPSPQPLAGRIPVSDFPLTQIFTASTLLQGPSKTSLFSATGQDDEYLDPTDIGKGKSPSRSPKLLGDDFEQGDHSKDVNQVGVRRDHLQVTPPKVPVQKIKKGTSEKGSRGDIGTPLNKGVASAKRVPPKVRSSKKKITFGKEWETFMKSRIREDNDLSLRVIRYEPVKFCSFLKLAKVYAPSSSEAMLKTHLRRFLDNQAIHFYEGKVWSR